MKGLAALLPSWREWKEGGRKREKERERERGGGGGRGEGGRGREGVVGGKV